MRNRAQSSVELIIILAVSLMIIVLTLQFSNTSMNSYQKTVEQKKATNALNKISSSSDLVYQQGYGAKTQAYVSIPRDVKNVTIEDKTMTIEYNTGNKQYINFEYEVAGDLPEDEGTYKVELQAMKGFVLISTNVSEEAQNYASCGNDIKEVGEECDGTDLDGKDCTDFGFLSGNLGCVNCNFDTSACSSLFSEICNDGTDNDGNSLTDCMDNACIGSTGPNGGVCCAAQDNNCPGDNNCRECGMDNECDNYASGTLCESNYLCSNSGDNGYDKNGNIPSQGFCDGNGYCDFASSTPTCTLDEGSLTESSGFTTCVDGETTCIDTCTDGLDNDNDGCTDAVDGNCGGSEGNCGDLIDNNCDGYVDCDDPTCSSNPLCLAGVESDCTNGIDDDSDGHTDCDDSNCVGQLGPNGGVCCDDNKANCAGHDQCKACGVDDECVYSSIATVCDVDYLCSVSGDNGYGDTGKIPSQGYCDGNGGCDYSKSNPLCTYNSAIAIEGVGVTLCYDGSTACTNSCSDGQDNDNDGCTDTVDSDCGGAESGIFCNDGIDNDCDSYTDCDDSSCNSAPNCLSNEIDCNDGLDNDGDDNKDCDDTDCIGYIGPNGGICCGGSDSNCVGDSLCKNCAVDNECEYYDNSVACNLDYYCSGAGDDGFNTAGRIPSQGFCDGSGGCDYASSSPICSYSAGDNLEGTAKTICKDGESSCVDTCTDNFDNDYDGCTDSDDANCGGTETICDDGYDNDCDGNLDCDDTDCGAVAACLDCDERNTCSLCAEDGECSWCDGGWLGSGCNDNCKTGFLSSCWGGSCIKKVSSCP